MKLNTIYSYFIIILFSPLIGKLIKNITIYYKSYKELKKSDLLYNLVHRLTPHEFEIWCSEYLSNIGFNNIVVLPLRPDGGKDIICEKNSEKFYVECKRYSISDSITAFEIEKLLGAMICDNINNGIIITTGTISDEAKSILNKIEKPYNISIISSKDLAIPYTEYVLNPN